MNAGLLLSSLGLSASEYQEDPGRVQPVMITNSLAVQRYSCPFLTCPPGVGQDGMCLNLFLPWEQAAPSCVPIYLRIMLTSCHIVIY